MTATTDKILESLKTLSLLEASELVKQIEEAFGVSAAASAGVVMAAAPAAAAEAVEEQTEFDVMLTASTPPPRSRCSRPSARSLASAWAKPRP